MRIATWCKWTGSIDGLKQSLALFLRRFHSHRGRPEIGVNRDPGRPNGSEELMYVVFASVKVWLAGIESTLTGLTIEEVGTLSEAVDDIVDSALGTNRKKRKINDSSLRKAMEFIFPLPADKPRFTKKGNTIKGLKWSQVGVEQLAQLNEFADKHGLDLRGYLRKLAPAIVAIFAKHLGHASENSEINTGPIPTRLTVVDTVGRARSSRRRSREEAELVPSPTPDLPADVHEPAVASPSPPRRASTRRRTMTNIPSATIQAPFSRTDTAQQATPGGALLPALPAASPVAAAAADCRLLITTGLQHKASPFTTQAANTMLYHQPDGASLPLYRRVVNLDPSLPFDGNCPSAFQACVAGMATLLHSPQGSSMKPEEHTHSLQATSDLGTKANDAIGFQYDNNASLQTRNDSETTAMFLPTTNSVPQEQTRRRTLDPSAVWELSGPYSHRVDKEAMTSHLESMSSADIRRQSWEGLGGEGEPRRLEVAFALV